MTHEPVAIAFWWLRLFLAYLTPLPGVLFGRVEVSTAVTSIVKRNFMSCCCDWRRLIITKSRNVCICSITVWIRTMEVFVIRYLAFNMDGDSIET
jgi:hypothetical protein